MTSVDLRLIKKKCRLGGAGKLSLAFCFSLIENPPHYFHTKRKPRADLEKERRKDGRMEGRKGGRRGGREEEGKEGRKEGKEKGSEEGLSNFQKYHQLTKKKQRLNLPCSSTFA